MNTDWSVYVGTPNSWAPHQLDAGLEGGETARQLLTRFTNAVAAMERAGDEVVAPGTPLAPGKLYASNVATLAAWCSSAGLAVTTRILPDARDAILAGLQESLAEHDAILTSGGAWNSDRDLVVRLLDELGLRLRYPTVATGLRA